MSCRHIDIVAVAVLLLGMALFSKTRHVVSVAIPHGRIIAEPFHRPLVLVPNPPHVAFTFE